MASGCVGVWVCGGVWVCERRSSEMGCRWVRVLTSRCCSTSSKNELGVFSKMEDNAPWIMLLDPVGATHPPTHPPCSFEIADMHYHMHRTGASGSSSAELTHQECAAKASPGLVARAR